MTKFKEAITDLNILIACLIVGSKEIIKARELFS